MNSKLIIAFLSIALTTINTIKADQNNDIVRVIKESNTNCDAPCSRMAVLFIHGLAGSKETWLNSRSGTYWPDLIATDINLSELIEVYRVDYDSFLFSEGPSIVEVLIALQNKLDLLFEEKQFSRVVLVGHSLGGNIARAYLMHVKAKYGHGVLSHFQLTITLGTPMKGSSFANIGRLVSANQQLRILRPIRINDFQQLLNATLVDIVNKHHRAYCGNLNIHAAYEERGIFDIGLIVSKESATAYSDLSRGFPRDHMELAKPVDKDDPIHLWVAEQISACALGNSPCGTGAISDHCSFAPEGQPDPSWEIITRLRSSAQD